MTRTHVPVQIVRPDRVIAWRSMEPHVVRAAIASPDRAIDLGEQHHLVKAAAA